MMMKYSKRPTAGLVAGALMCVVHLQQHLHEGWLQDGPGGEDVPRQMKLNSDDAKRMASMLGKGASQHAVWRATNLCG